MTRRLHVVDRLAPTLNYNIGVDIQFLTPSGREHAATSAVKAAIRDGFYGKLDWDPPLDDYPLQSVPDLDAARGQGPVPVGRGRVEAREAVGEGLEACTAWMDEREKALSSSTTLTGPTGSIRLLRAGGR